MPLSIFDSQWDRLSPAAQMRRRWQESSPEAQFQERFASLSPFARLRRQPQLRLEDIYEPSQEEVDTKVKELGSSAGMNALQTFGNVLDTFGGAVRTGLYRGDWNQDRNPTGREMLESWGWLNPNQEGLDWGDVAGFGAELLTDPLTYLGFGLSGGLKAGGKAIAKAGLLNKLPSAASWKMQRLYRHALRSGVKPTAEMMGGVAVKEGGKIVGSRAARTLTNVWDVVRHEPADVQKYVLDSLMSKGYSLKEARRLPIGGAFGVGVPFTSLHTGIGGWGLSRRLGGNAMDWLGAASRWSYPGRLLAQAFSPAAGNMFSKEAQIAARDAYHGITAAEQVGRGMGVRHLLELDPIIAKYGDDPMVEVLRAKVEKIAPSTRIGQRVQRTLAGMDPNDVAIIDKVVGTQRQQLADFLRNYRNQGLSLNPMDPDFISHFPRYLNAWGSGTDPAAKLFQTYFPSQRARVDLFRNIPEGTAAIDEMVRLKSLVGPNRRIQNLDQATQAILNRYGYGFMPRDQAKKLAQWLADLPGVQPRQYGAPLWDFTQYMTKGHASQAAGKAAVNFIGTHAKPMGPGMVPLDKVFAGMGGFADRAGAYSPELLQRITERMHLPQGTFTDLSLIGLPEELVQDAVRFLPKPRAFEGLNPGMNLWDRMTNLFRSNVTIPFPAFHVRNRDSGIVANYMGGMGSLNPFKFDRAGRMLRGGMVRGAENFPWIKSELAARGIAATPENVQRLLQEAVASTNLIGAVHAAKDINTTALGNAFDHMIPGRNPAMGSYIGAIKGGAQATKGTNFLNRWLNFTNVRGAFAKGDTMFTPARIGENLSWSVEARNRLAPFLNLLEKGYTPQAAAELVQKFHINYSKRAFTNFENTILSRMVPFYRFHSRMLANTAKQLAARPGGPYGQMIRLVNRLQDDTSILPDYLRQGIAVPLGQNKEGGPRVLGGFSLMHEPALQHIANTANMAMDMPGMVLGNKGSWADFGKMGRQEAGELASQAHPLAKAGIEWALGRSLFQRGPEGGRDLASQDPVIGRTILNAKKLLGYADMADNNPKYLPAVAEHLAANSPLARVFSSLRQVSDYRRHDPYYLPLLASLGAGFRITDVSPNAQESILSEIVKSEMMQTGEGKAWEEAYIPLEAIQNMAPDEAYNAIMLSRIRQILKARAKARGANMPVPALAGGLMPPR